MPFVIEFPQMLVPIDFRERLALQIIAKVVGQTEVKIENNKLSFGGSIILAQKVQALYDDIVPHLEYVLEQSFLSVLHNKDLTTDQEIELHVKSA